MALDVKDAPFQIEKNETELLLSSLLFCLIISCSEETFIQHGKDKFQQFINSLESEIAPSQLPSLYFYDFMKNKHPAMAKETLYSWSENNQQFVSISFSTNNMSIQKTKISIGFIKEGYDYKITEIRESWKCKGGNNNSNFSNEKCK